jgi:VWFA-related protein
MRSKTKVLTHGAAALVAWALAGPAWARESAQQPAQQTDQQAPAIKAEVSLVNIFATVRDRKKRIVPDLKKEDFRVFENDQEQKIAFFSAEKALPITLALLIDTSGSEQNRLPAEQDAASRFLSQVLRKGDEAMVVSFDLDVDLLSDFTEDRAQLQRAIHHAQINAAGPMVTPGTLPSGPICTMRSG